MYMSGTHDRACYRNQLHLHVTGHVHDVFELYWQHIKSAIYQRSFKAICLDLIQ